SVEESPDVLFRKPGDHLDRRLLVLERLMVDVGRDSEDEATEDPVGSHASYRSPEETELLGVRYPENDELEVL
ncbi:MAG TPA: hypothetical protein VNP73_01525, partial [Actinomycetota bacterium]|nr:hypothetical protein [Actinomycetota bacterium]